MHSVKRTTGTAIDPCCGRDAARTMQSALGMRAAGGVAGASRSGALGSVNLHRSPLPLQWCRFSTTVNSEHSHSRSRHVLRAATRPFIDPSVPLINQDSGVCTSEIIARATNKSLEELTIKAAKTNLKVAHQGVPGAYSEVAARKSCPDYEPLPCTQFEIAFQALTQWLVDRAVQPIENSLGGSIHTVYDLLIRYRVHIVGETSLKINHCLCALPGTKAEDITHVMSHPQALAQCDGFIRKMGYQRVAVDDTATAAQQISTKRLKNTGAISSSRAAELYGLEILETGIQDVKDNVTRFVVLSRDPLVNTENDMRPYKTSVVFSLGDGPGQLFKALAVFALRDLDLLKIESRPLRSNPLVMVEGTGNSSRRMEFNYLFYLDFMGKLSDERVQNAMRHLQESAPFVRVLGSFPMDTDLGATNVETMFANWKPDSSE